MSRTITSIDLNADLGEECGDDSALLSIVSSANIAAGGHAGGGSVLEETVHQAIENKVSIGAHPAYPDKTEFGRISRAEEYSFQELINEIQDQILLVAEAAKNHGEKITHVKPHGALYHDAHSMPWVAEAIVFATSELSEELETQLYLTGLPNSLLYKLAKENGQKFIAEGFADRTYQDDGMLTPRNMEAALISEPAHSMKQVLDMVFYGNTTALSGNRIPVKVETICLHGDNKKAVLLANEIKNVLLSNNIEIASPYLTRSQ